MSELSEKLAQLSSEQLKAITLRFRQQKARAGAAIACQPRDRAHFPLSFSQRRLWFLCQLAPDSVAYNNPVAVRLRAAAERSMNLDPQLLAESLNELVKRHESLRTTFTLADGEPVQIIGSTLTVPMRYLDLETTAPAERDAAAMAILREDVQRPFDLIKGPLLRITILRLADSDYILLINMHHLISDAWSVGVLMRELMMVAMAKKAGLPVLLPALPIQYADFAVWQREHLQGEVYQRLVDYWKEKLAGPLPLLRLPMRRAERSAGSVGATHYARLSPALTQAVKTFARTHNTTIFVVLLAVYKLLLRRYTREDDIVVGTPVANRTREEVEGLLGCFINTLVLRTDMAGPASFGEIVQRVAVTTRDALGHQDFPFDLLVSELQPQRDLHTHPLFQTMFSLQSSPIETSSIGAAMKMVELDNASTKFDLTLTAMELNDVLSLNWTYCADVIGAAAIKRMAGHYHTLLAAALQMPDSAVDDLPMMDAEEHAQIVLLRAGVGDSERELHYCGWFDRAAARHPDAPALRQDDSVFSYRDLQQSVEAMAKRLRSNSIGRGDIVALLFERSPVMVACMLAVMKAGAAFLPLDPAWPAQRIAKVMRIADARLTIVDERLAERLPAKGTRIALAAGILPGGDVLDVSGAPTVEVVPDDLAYVMFTSGSTGEPKGVAVEHAQLTRYVQNIAARMQLPDGASYAAVSTLAADLAYTMVFPALVGGGCLLLPSENCMNSPAALADWLARYPADALKIVPSHLDSLLELEEPQRLLPRRLLVLGGEACPSTLLRKLAGLDSHLRVLNHYGPTETTVGVITAEIDLANAGAEVAIPLGRPLGDARIYICDAALHCVPMGVPGELCIGGPTVARGYVGHDAEAIGPFRADPYATEPAARLYCSGDLACLREDGQINFLGRMDDQVKIRGFRVEPAELEAAIRSWPGARDAAVKTVKHNGVPQLAAWVVAAAQPDPAALLAYLRERLTAAMLPSFLQFVDALPLTSNGKIDRAALCLNTVATAGESAVFVAPRTRVELDLAMLWKQLLGRDRIGVRDNFFDLGGHSLLAVRLVAAVQKTFGIALPLASLFENATIERLARLLKHPGAGLPNAALVPIQPAGEKPPLFFVHPAGGNVLCYYQLSSELGREQPFYGLQSVALDAAGVGSLVQMASTYVDAVMQQQPNGPYHLGGWSMGGVVAFEMAQQLRKRGREVALLAILDIPAPGGIRRADRERIDDATALAIYARKIELFSGAALGLDNLDLAQMSAVALGEHIVAAMRDAQLVPAEITAAQFRQFMEVQKAHNYASLTYLPEPYDGPLVVIRCNAPPAVRLEADLLNLDALYAEESLGWAPLCSQPLTIHRVAGNHFQMMAPPNLRTIAAILHDHLH